MTKDLRQKNVGRCGLGGRAGAISAFIAGAVFAALPVLAMAQQAAAGRSDAALDADDARMEAILGTFNRETPAPFDSLYATAPGAEQQAPRPLFRLNLLAPLNFDSNVEALPSGGTASLGSFPIGNLSFAAPLGDLPFRISASANSELKRFFDVSDSDVDRLTLSGRIQYVDANNDQAFSPYLAFTPRWSFSPTFADQTEQRQDFNFGFNKRWNFDNAFQPVSVGPNSSADTVWSLGLTTFGQLRLRQPQLSSEAVFVIPSLGWAISENWNANLAVELLGRWYERDAQGNADHDWEVMPIATVEYVLPASLFGKKEVADLFGRPSIAFQASHLTVWSTTPNVDYGQWEASVTLKTGWSF